MRLGGRDTTDGASVAREYAFHLAEEAAAGRLSRAELLRRAAVVGLSASTVQMLATACGGGGGDGGSAAVGPPRRGGSLVLGTPVSGREPDPWFAIDTGGVVATQLACEYLTRPGPENVLQPALATSWRPGATTQEWTFDLRRDVRFHDGSALTAADVVATFEVIADPKLGSSALSAFGGVLSPGGVEQVGPDRVRFHLDRPYADFPYLVSTTRTARSSCRGRTSRGRSRKAASAPARSSCASTCRTSGCATSAMPGTGGAASRTSRR